MAPQQLNLSGEQATALREVLTDFNDGDSVFLTQQGDGTLMVAFSCQTVEIRPGGQTEEV